MADRNWKLGDDISRNDNVLDGVTFEDLILAVHHNCRKITPKSVHETMVEILDQRMLDTAYLIENNMKEIIEAAMEGRK